MESHLQGPAHGDTGTYEYTHKQKPPPPKEKQKQNNKKKKKKKKKKRFREKRPTGWAMSCESTRPQIRACGLTYT